MAVNEQPRRLLAPDDIPPSLWNPKDQRLFIAPLAAAAWTSLLDRHNLRSIAAEVREESIVGGISSDATKKHLAWNYPGSCARVQLALLDPRGDLPEISDAFARIFSGGHVLLVDLPCACFEKPDSY